MWFTGQFENGSWGFQQEGCPPRYTSKYEAECIKDMYTAGKKLVKWLHTLADKAEEDAKTTRFITMKEAWEADMKNYRATAEDMEKALAKANGGLK